MIDKVNRLEEIKHRYAGFWARLLAHNIDLLPILLLYYVASFLIPKSDYDYLFIGGIYLLYHVLFEISRMQGTPGKKWTKIKVTKSNYQPITFYQSVIRNICKFFSLVLVFGGFVAIFFNPKRKALHDYIGGTLVLFDED